MIPLRWFLLGSIALMVFADGVVANKLSNRRQSDQQNLIVIMTDEHNFRTLGCYRETMQGRQAYMWGPAIVETPNIDWIARHGAICTSFYATTPVCSPSRASFVSGLYPQKTPVVSNNIPLDDGVVTFGHLLAQHGYKTGFAGKWHLDGDAKPGWMPKRKFGFDDNRFMFNRGHWKKLELTETGPRVAARKNNRPTYAVDGANNQTFTTDFLIDRSIEFIDQNQETPFCYMICLPDPHGPDTVRAPYDTMFDHQTYVQPTTFDKSQDGQPSWGRKQKSNKFGQAKYYGMIKCIDDNIGRLIDKLRQEQLLDRTTIVFTADHGDLRSEHHRQNKGVPYEGSTRVPFLIYCPGQIPPSHRVDQALGSIDFTPTVLKLLGVETERTFDGRDASLLLCPGNQTVEWDDLAFVRGTGRQNGWLMSVSDRHKLIFSTNDPPWFFDLKRDPDEVANLFSHPGYREIIRKMAIQLNEYCITHNEPFANNERIKSDIEWAISGSGEYKAPKTESRKK